MDGNPRPAEPSSDVKFEIGHVLFIDIVGYSKLLINQQSDRLETLKSIVRGTEQSRKRKRRASCCGCPPIPAGAASPREAPSDLF